MSKYSIIVLAGIFLILASFSHFTPEKQQNNTHQPTITTTPQELTTNEYNQLRNQLVDILTKQNPRAALALLRQKATSNESIARSCHDLVHEIGHESYEKYGDFGQTMQYQDELCNSGYLHGIIESHFGRSQNIFSTMKSVCKNYNATTFIGWECFHGVGHGLMYFTENDLPKSLSLCDTYNNVDAQMACINGVFMENFNIDQKLHQSKFIDANKPFFPCTEQKNRYKTDCYLYAPNYFLSINKNDYSQALKLCKTAEKDFRLTCATGVGSQAIKEHINNPKLVESVCMQGSSEEIHACITGMVGLYINHFGRLNEAKKLCSKFEESNQSTCQQVILSQTSLFQ